MSLCDIFKLSSLNVSMNIHVPRHDAIFWIAPECSPSTMIKIATMPPNVLAIVIRTCVTVIFGVDGAMIIRTRR